MMIDDLRNVCTTGSALIVDDHPIVLYGLRFALETEGSFVVCGEAADAESARTMTADLRPDYIVLDLVLGGRDGIDLVRDLVVTAPGTRVLVYSSQSEQRYARRVIAAGAKGFVAKSEGLDVVTAALNQLARGETFVGKALRRQLVDDFVATGSDVAGDMFVNLSERETQVLRQIAEGCSTSTMAAALGVSAKTIGTYRDRLKIKLAVTSGRDLVLLAHDRFRGC